MDDTSDAEHVCPLCCEELDISDQQFFPCKCGYQVCMWCWHRIRESESGLCPACRTPYGDDPHEFSAVDVEEVLKANKEKEAAAKKERQRQQQGSDATPSDMETLAQLLDPSLKGQMEIPKDRGQLGNMRVIRRNLVYCVGLPMAIATEEILKKPEYFGQYGKMAKIVLNRSQTAGGDPRRASASAYVTFVHKEDTLACILALDGFYMEGRSIRASYGTSKYCSAFIKNVRCNNPECTYLHEMGDVEDTFTKQEIQAGYVTSGRDVLARQQQIVEESLNAVTGSGGVPRRRTGGGGPSGTGRASSNPVFPVPTYDEAIKPVTTTLVPPPPQGRSVTTGAAFPPMGVAPTPAPIPTPSTAVRSSSAGPTAGAFVTGPKGAIGATPHVAQKNVLRGHAITGPPGATAASVVAGVHNINGASETPAPHMTLTPLTPLKRVTKGGTKPDSSGELKGLGQTGTKLTSLRSGKIMSKTNGFLDGGSKGPGQSVSGIGGSVIAAPTSAAQAVGGPGSLAAPSGPSTLAGLGGGDALSGLGGEVFTGPLQSTSRTSAIGGGNAIGGKKWNATPVGGDPVLSVNPGGLWSGTGGSIGPNSQGIAPGSTSSGGQFSGGVIGGGTIGGLHHGSSALASMLGINLPTGSGSLRGSSDMWGSQAPSSHPPIASLNGSSMPVQGVIGRGDTSTMQNGLIGGVPIGVGSAPIGGRAVGDGGNKSDIALLQSLLPGVHITSGGTHNQGFGTIGGGNGNGNLGALGPQQSQQWNDGLHTGLGGHAIGTMGGGNQQKQRHAPGSIW